MAWIDIDEQGLIATHRIIAVGRAASAPLRRQVAALDESLVMDLTGGKRRETILFFDSGHAAWTPLSLETLRRVLTQR